MEFGGLGSAARTVAFLAHLPADYSLDCDRRQTMGAFSYEGQKLGISFSMIAVEMDGHDFHERTKEQVVLRNQRDRDLQSMGFKVLHFSGTEIYQDPIRVVTDVVSAGTAELNRFCVKLAVEKRIRYGL